MPIVERTHYYSKPNLGEAVLAMRRRANAVRQRIGLPAGTIRVKQDGDGPDVTWECVFPSIEAHGRDLAARAESAEFAAVRGKMRELIARFERCIERSDDAPSVGWVGDRDIVGLPVVPQAISFRSGGHRLVGYLYLPPGPGPFPCMITNHGSTIDKGTNDICRPGTAALLMSWGIASFLPHRRGYGNSTGPSWRDEVPAEKGTDAYDEQLVARLERESDDVLAALRVLLARPEILPDHIGVMGSSFGGINTLLAAARSDRMRCAVEFAGAAMNWERTPRLRALMLAAAQRLSHPIFFIQAANDFSIGPTIALVASLEGASKTVRSKIYPQWGLTPEEGHLFERQGGQVWGPDVRRFLERWL